MQHDPSLVEAAIQAMHRAGFHVAWVERDRRHIFIATEYATGEKWMVGNEDPLAAIAELQRLCGFEDID